MGLLSAGTSAYTSLMSVSAFAGFANFVQAERIAVSGLSSGFLYSLQTNTLTGFLGKWPSSLNAFAGGTYAGSLALCPTHLTGSNFPRFGVFRNAGPTPSTPGPGPYVNPGIDADVHIGNNNYLRFQGGILVGTWVTGPVAGGADTGGSALLNGEGMEGSAEQVAPIGFDGELPTLDGTFTQTLDAWDTANIGFDASTSATFLLNGNDVQYEDGLIWD